MKREQNAKSTHPNMEIKDIVMTHSTKLCSKGNGLEGDKGVEKENGTKLVGERN